MAAGAPIAPEDVPDLLGRLVDASLVQIDRGRPGARYRLLETVRRYAAGRLDDSGGGPATRNRHLEWCLTLAEQAEPALLGGAQLDWLGRLDAEHANLRAALGWALERPPGGPPGGEAGARSGRALRLAGALGRYWDIRGHRAEGLGWLERALAGGRDGPPGARARALRAAGLLGVAARRGPAQAWLEESLALCRATGDRAGAAWALFQLGGVALDRGDDGRGAALMAQALAAADAAGDGPCAAWAEEALGFATAERGDRAAGQAHLEASLARFRELGDAIGAATALRHIGAARLEWGDAAGARAPLEEGLALLRALGDVPAVAWALHDLGRLALDAGELRRATALFEECLHLFRKTGHAAGAAWALHNLGRTALYDGDPARAVARLEAGLALFREMGHVRGAAWALYNLAWAALDRHDRRRAAALIAGALAGFRAPEYLTGAAACLVAAARLAAASGDPQGAAHTLGVGEALHRAMGAPPAPGDRARAEDVARTVRAALGAPAFAAAHAAGATLSAARARRWLHDLQDGLGET